MVVEETYFLLWKLEVISEHMYWQSLLFLRYFILFFYNQFTLRFEYKHYH